MSPLLVIHIAGGGVGIACGTVAMAARKGGRVHRASGSVFVAAMFAMAAAAILLALTLSDWANLAGGIFAFYLVATGWAALTRRTAMARFAERAGLALGGAAIATALLLTFQANASPTGLINGKSGTNFAIVAGLATFAVSLDLRMLGPGAVPRSAQVMRHIWRMGSALFIGTGSFFLGQQKVMPLWMQGSPVLFVLALAPLVVMAFWLVRATMRGSSLATAVGRSGVLAILRHR